MVSICILNWNNLSELQITLAKLRSLSIEHEVIVYDQGSTDGSKYYLSQLQLPNLTVILNDKNVGNSISRNVMIRKAKYDYILLLDADIIPIDNSIEMLYEFLSSNPEYSIIGYNWNFCTKNWNEVTEREISISINDVYTNGELSTALTQYGLFRRNHLLECPFPEFFPFDREGWGAEDDLVGLTILENNLGHIGMVNGRCYYHNSKSSWRQLKDEVARLYAIRYVYYRYFQWFLDGVEKKKSLQTKVLSLTNLDIVKYFYKIGDNLGDVATDFIFKEIFPFFRLYKKSGNLLLFGGSIYDHVPNAALEFNNHFSKVEMFGVGLSHEREILDYSTEVSIHPRGHSTYNMLAGDPINLHPPVGDVLQLFSLLPLPEYSDSLNSLHIVDAYGFDAGEEEGFLVSKFNNHLNSVHQYLNLVEFLEKLTAHKEVRSSQIHPFFISLMMGNGGKLIPKDYRSQDLLYFNGLNFSMTREQAKNLRINIQQGIPKFIDSFFKVLLKYKVNV